MLLIFALFAGGLLMMASGIGLYAYQNFPLWGQLVVYGALTIFLVSVLFGETVNRRRPL